MSDFKPKFYLETPDEEEVEREVVKFYEANGIVKRKCGISTRAAKRYGGNDMWDKVEEKDYFGYAKDFSIAREVELMAIKILKKRNWYHEHLDTNPCRRGQNEDNYVIYFVTAKTPDDCCPICERVAIREQHKRQQHLEYHVKEKESWMWVKSNGEKYGDKEAIEDADKILGWPLRGEVAEPVAKKAKKEGN